MLKFLLFLSPFTAIGMLVVAMILYTMYEDWKVRRLYNNDRVSTKRFKNEA